MTGTPSLHDVFSKHRETENPAGNKSILRPNYTFIRLNRENAEHSWNDWQAGPSSPPITGSSFSIRPVPLRPDAAFLKSSGDEWGEKQKGKGAENSRGLACSSRDQGNRRENDAEELRNLWGEFSYLRKEISSIRDAMRQERPAGNKTTGLPYPPDRIISDAEEDTGKRQDALLETENELKRLVHSIENRQSALEDMERKISIRQEELLRREKEISGTEAELLQKLREIEKDRDLICRKEEDIERIFRKVFISKDACINSTGEEHQSKDMIDEKISKAKENTLSIQSISNEEKEKSLRNMSDDLAEKEKMIRERESMLEDTRDSLSKIEDEISRKVDELEKDKAMLGQKEDEIRSVLDMFEKEKKGLAIKDKESKDRAAELDRRWKEIEKREKKLEERIISLEDREKKLAVLKEESDNAEEKLRMFERQKKQVQALEKRFNTPMEKPGKETGADASREGTTGTVIMKIPKSIKVTGQDGMLSKINNTSEIAASGKESISDESSQANMLINRFFDEASGHIKMHEYKKANSKIAEIVRAFGTMPMTHRKKKEIYYRILGLKNELKLSSLNEPARD